MEDCCLLCNRLCHLCGHDLGLLWYLWQNISTTSSTCVLRNYKKIYCKYMFLRIINTVLHTYPGDNALDFNHNIVFENWTQIDDIRRDQRFKWSIIIVKPFELISIIQGVATRRSVRSLSSMPLGSNQITLVEIGQYQKKEINVDKNNSISGEKW